MRKVSFHSNIALIYLLSGCAVSEDGRKTGVLQSLKQNPQRALELVYEIEDPIERTLFITDLVEQHPNRTKSLCIALPTSQSQERCHRITERPHLWKPQRNHFEPSDIATPSERICTLDPHPNTCWTAQAIQDLTIDTNKASDSCAHIDDSRWQAECFFTLAEQVANEDSLDLALRFCDNTQQFQKSCWLHVVLKISQSSSVHSNDWKWHSKITEQISTHETIDPLFRKDLAEHFMAQSIWRQWDDGVFDYSKPYPKIAQSTLQDLQSIEVLRWCDEPLQKLHKWAQLTNRVRKNHTPNCSRLKKPRGLKLELDLWTDLIPPENCTVSSFLGNSHRVHCPEDSVLDAQLSILEVSSRLRPIQSIFIQESLHLTPLLQNRGSQLNSMDLRLPPDRR